MFLLHSLTHGCFLAGQYKLGSKSPFSSSLSSKSGYCSTPDNAEKWNGKQIRKLWALWDIYTWSWWRVFLWGKHWKDLFIAVSGRVQNCCCASREHWGWQNHPSVSPPFGISVLPPVTLSNQTVIKEYCTYAGTCAVAPQQNGRHSWPWGWGQALNLHLCELKPQFWHKLPACLSLSVSC